MNTERPTCAECGEFTDDDGECGPCGNCKVPLCCHGDDYDKVAWKYDYPCDWWGDRNKIDMYEDRRERGEL